MFTETLGGLDRIWLPDIGSDQLEGVVSRRLSVEYYPASLGTTDLLRTMSMDFHRRDLVVLTEFSGFPMDYRIYESAKAAGAKVICDAREAFLSDNERTGCDAILLSPDLFLPMPTIGILKSAKIMNPGKVLGVAPPRLQIASLDLFKKSWIQTEGALDRMVVGAVGPEVSSRFGPWQATEISVAAMEMVRSVDEIKSLHRSNFLEMHRHLREFGVFSALPAAVVPYAYPITTCDLAAAKDFLGRHRIKSVHVESKSSTNAGRPESCPREKELIQICCRQRLEKETLTSFRSFLSGDGRTA